MFVLAVVFMGGAMCTPGNGNDGSVEVMVWYVVVYGSIIGICVTGYYAIMTIVGFF